MLSLLLKNLEGILDGNRPLSGDIPYLANCIGNDNLIIGSDYGHNDPSAEPMLVETLAERGDLSASLSNCILRTNPRALYGI